MIKLFATLVLLASVAAHAAEPMRVGHNFSPVRYYSHIPVYANLLLQGHDGWNVDTGRPTYAVDPATGYPATLSGGTVAFVFLDHVKSGIGDPDKGYPNGPSGTYTLTWTGPPRGLELKAHGNTTKVRLLTDEPNRRTYDVRPASEDLWNLRVKLVASAGGCSNARVTDPTVPAGWPSRFHPQFLTKAAGAACLRSMGALMTNSSNVTRLEDFTAESARSYGSAVASDRRVRLASIGPYVGPYFHPPDKVRFTLTTAVPHGYRTGEVLTLPAIPNLPLAEGGTLSIPANHRCHVAVLTETEVAGWIYRKGGGSLTGTTAAAGQLARPIASTLPLIDLCRLSAELGSDHWLNVPHAMPDEEVGRLADFFAAQFPRGRRVYLEYSNETWNTGYAFQQTDYCQSQGRLIGLAGDQWYALRAARVHAVFRERWTAAGRDPADLVRVLAGQYGNPARCVALLTFARAQGVPVDAFAVAPYFVTGPKATAAEWAALSIDQVMDRSEAAVARFPKPNLKPIRDWLRANAPACRLVCYEGGMELGVYPHSYASQPGGNEAAAARSRAWSRHPRILEQTATMLANSEASGVDLFCYFDLTVIAGNYGSLPFSAMWGEYNAAWNQPEGLGDGSDGLFDNRTDPDRLDRVVSPIAAAIRRRQGLWPPPAAAPGEAMGEAFPGLQPILDAIVWGHDGADATGRLRDYYFRNVYVPKPAKVEPQPEPEEPTDPGPEPEPEPQPEPEEPVDPAPVPFPITVETP